jgi:hypothetical protein
MSEHEQPSGQSTGSTDTARRKFLVKTSTGIAAGSIMATLPTKSVWATGIGNSMAASGHGSDTFGGVTLHLQDASYLVTHTHASVHTQTFKSVFGLNAYKFSGGAVSTYPDETTLIQVLTGMADTVTQDLELYGPNDINLNMVIVYLNALLDPTDGNITYPIIQSTNSFPFNSLSNFADYLGNEAAVRRLTTSSQLAALVANPNQSLI